MHLRKCAVLAAVLMSLLWVEMLSAYICPHERTDRVECPPDFDVTTIHQCTGDVWENPILCGEDFSWTSLYGNFSTAPAISEIEVKTRTDDNYLVDCYTYSQCKFNFEAGHCESSEEITSKKLPKYTTPCPP